MIAKLRIVAVVSTLLLTASVANAVNADNSTEPSHSVASQIGRLRRSSLSRDLAGGGIPGTFAWPCGSAPMGRCVAKVVESSGYRALDRASLRAGYSCKFGTGSKKSDSASAWTTVQYKWVVN